MGDKLDETKTKALKAGGYAHAAKGMQHFVLMNEDTVIQVHGLGLCDRWRGHSDRLKPRRGSAMTI
jgi:hypothetical protein